MLAPQPHIWRLIQHPPVTETLQLWQFAACPGDLLPPAGLVGELPLPSGPAAVTPQTDLPEKPLELRWLDGKTAGARSGPWAMH